MRRSQVILMVRGWELTFNMLQCGLGGTPSEMLLVKVQFMSSSID